MEKVLVIVESPAKAKTIGRYLGEGYTMAASVGHVRDLPTASIGVDVKQDFKPRYITMKGKDGVIRELKQKAATVDRVLLATDPDREGEAIAWHLAKVLKIDPTSPCRITFNEITGKAVRDAVAQPRSIDLSLVDAQQARRILDRLVGYELSPLLWNKIKKGLSAGRVQSVAMRMIVEREEEIEAFEPEEYWVIDAKLNTAKGEPLTLRYHGALEDGRVVKKALKNAEQAQAVVSACQNQVPKVHEMTQKARHRHPAAPFTTSTLQQDAARRLGFSSRRTMSVAQQLYEGIHLPDLGPTALVTYIRTDSTRSAQEAITEIRKEIKQRYGSQYLPDQPRIYRNKQAAQDAHEAIRPAHFDLPPQAVSDALSSDQFKLYRLIWERFVASQMASATVDKTTLDVCCANSVFRVTGEVIRFPGFLEAYGDHEVSQTPALPAIEANEALTLVGLDPQQKFTKPPARFNEASLIKAMEEAGIGRPSTYAPTVSTLLDRHYVEKAERALMPTQTGRLVTDLLREHFNAFINTGFTAEMESKLDEVEANTLDWVDLLKAFYPVFHEQIETASQAIQRIELPVKETGEDCPECGHPLIIREGRYGPFVSCSQFPTCKFTKPIEHKAPAHCPQCGGTLLIRKTRRGKPYYLCKKDGDQPDCDFISWDLPIDGEPCPTCGSYQVFKSYRRQLYKRCANPDCPSHEQAKAARKTRVKAEEQHD